MTSSVEFLIDVVNQHFTKIQEVILGTSNVYPRSLDDILTEEVIPVYVRSPDSPTVGTAGCRRRRAHENIGVLQTIGC